MFSRLYFKSIKMHTNTKILHEQIKQLQRKREKINETFLDALVYPGPLNNVKRLFFELKAIDNELSTLKITGNNTTA